MPAIVAFVSQKGGVGKSTLARALATLAAEEGLSVRLADLDWKQQTAKHWSDVRSQNGIEPQIDCRVYDSAIAAIDEAKDVDLLVIDQPGYASGQTADLAQQANLVIEPTGPSIDDMRPGVLVLHELAGEGIAKDKMAVALFRVGSAAEERRARAYMSEYGYTVLDGYMPEKMSLRQAQDNGHAVTEAKGGALRGPADDLMAAMLTKLGDEMGRGQEKTNERPVKRQRVREVERDI